MSMSDAFYEEVDPRRKQERHDARMISEDQNAMSNLSERAIYRTFHPGKHVEHLNMFDQSQD